MQNVGRKRLEKGGNVPSDRVSHTPELWRVDVCTKNNQKSAGAPPPCALRTPRFGCPPFLLLLALANGAKRARRELMSQVGKWGRRGNGEALESR